MLLGSNVTTRNYSSHSYTEEAHTVPPPHRLRTPMEERKMLIPMNKANYGTGPPKCAIPPHIFSTSS